LKARTFNSQWRK